MISSNMTLTGNTVKEIGDIENAAIVVYDDDDNIIGCGQIEVWHGRDRVQRGCSSPTGR